MAGLVYPFFLIVLATLYAFKTRKCPGGFNETKFIFFANTVTTIHWFAYVPLYLASTDNEIRAVILAFSLSMSGILQLCSLVLPKLYVVRIELFLAELSELSLRLSGRTQVHIKK